jgi:capsular polysaccharide export protein
MLKMACYKYLFISRKSSHFKYYKKVVKYIGESAKLICIKKFPFPRVKYWSKVNELDINDLTKTHLQRKLIRHPSLQSSRLFSNLIYLFYCFREKCRASYYFAYFDKTQIDNLVVWNGMKQPNRTPYLVAKAMGIKTFVFENGLLPHTTALDPKGVNAHNSLPREASFYHQWQPKNKMLDNVSLEVRQAKNKACRESQNVELPDTFIFVPFQVPNDTQIICHSPWLKTMEALFSAVSEALEHARTSTGKDIKVVMKEHPSWPKNFEHLYQINPNIVFLNGMNTQSLIESSTAVATINSTVGIEALFLNKQVITMGDCCFNIDGMVTNCLSQSALNNAFEASLDNKFNPELTHKFLSYLKEVYLLPWTWSKVDKLEDDDYQNHFDAVLQVLES